jgi:hypothetical protein
MAGCVTNYIDEKAATVIESLRSGRRPGSVAQLVNASRSTLYAWRAENAEFVARWDEATATPPTEWKKPSVGRPSVATRRRDVLAETLEARAF